MSTLSRIIDILLRGTTTRLQSEVLVPRRELTDEESERLEQYQARLEDQSDDLGDQFSIPFLVDAFADNLSRKPRSNH